MKTKMYSTLVMLLITAQAFAASIRGKVVDNNGDGLYGVTITEIGTNNGTVSDASGSFLLQMISTGNSLRFSIIGFETKVLQANDNMEVSMQKKSKSINQVTITGSRNTARTNTASVSPIDVINLREVTSRSGQLDLNQLLQYAAPSFNSNRQSGSDGADHIDPASLRGLGPDQTLVLVNGKRRHQSSLVNLYGSRGRGNSGTDLNAIPVSAIERIEILRDGAAAQYGSDAIAGVINIILKTGTENLDLGLSAGAYNAKYNYHGNKMDGLNTLATANYGFKVTKKGYVNLTAEYNMRNHTNRAKVLPDSLLARREFGDAKVSNLALWANGNFAISENTNLYAFGGVNKRRGEAFAWTRFAGDDRNIPSIYPNGFDPIIGSNIIDKSACVGIKTNYKNWKIDFSNTYGKNNFLYDVSNTLNSSMGSTSPTSFEAGGYNLAQNTINLDLNKNFENILKGFNLGFGAEYRNEWYNIVRGAENSYKAYVDTLAPGSQGFPGFQPSDEIQAKRSNVGAYVDADLNITKPWSVTAALRFENYSDFGKNLSWKFATRYQIIPALAARATISTGFRAPSLPQINFNQTITNFIAGAPVEVLIARNNGAVAKALGIPALKQETSQNFSIGIAAKPFKNTSVTVDYYNIKVKDRVVLTGQFTDSDPDVGALLTALKVAKAQLFTNAVNTSTRGLDIVISNSQNLNSNSKLITTLAANINKLTIDKIYTNTKLVGKEDTYFDLREKYFLQYSAPPSKVSLGLDYIVKKLTVSARLTRFGEVKFADWNYDETKLNVYTARNTVDLSMSYKFKGGVQATIGATNLLNAYPVQFDPINTESGGAWDPVQMGNNGRFLFAKLRANLSTNKK